MRVGGVEIVVVGVLDLGWCRNWSVECQNCVGGGGGVGYGMVSKLGSGGVEIVWVVVGVSDLGWVRVGSGLCGWWLRGQGSDLGCVGDI